jgi:cytochrome c-type biogenesis protein CcsB
MMDNISYVCIVVGFAMLTLGLITGFVYAKAVWGRFWSWDPKEVWAGITWLFYAVLLHGRLTVGWRGRRSAIMAVIGFAVLIFTFLGVNLFMEGHHEEFTKF